LLVQPDFTFVTADGESSRKRGRNRAELVVGLVGPLDSDATLGIQSRVDRKHILATDSVEEASRSVLCAFVFVGDHLDSLVCLPSCLVFLHDFARLKVEVDQTILIVLVDEKHRALVVVKKQVFRLK
jgi:hypothetical protein